MLDPIFHAGPLTSCWIALVVLERTRRAGAQTPSWNSHFMLALIKRRNGSFKSTVPSTSTFSLLSRCFALKTKVPKGRENSAKIAWTVREDPSWRFMMYRTLHAGPHIRARSHIRILDRTSRAGSHTQCWIAHAVPEHTRRAGAHISCWIAHAVLDFRNFRVVLALFFILWPVLTLDIFLHIFAET